VWSAEESGGWVVNLSRPEYTTTEYRPWQRPVFFFDDGAPCYEVWFWCAAVSRWFVMATLQHDALTQQGVVFFSPDETPEQLRARVLAIDPGVTWQQ
jgi:hypothetical protein